MMIYLLYKIFYILAFEFFNKKISMTFVIRLIFLFIQNEAMTGTHTQNPVYSRITLALMEDTGWYSANYSMAQELGWGKNLGCNFAMKSCKEWISTKSSPLSWVYRNIQPKRTVYRNDYMRIFKYFRGKSIHPFCNKVKQDPLQTECTDDRSSVALCNLVKHSQPLPKKYQVRNI